VVVLDRLPTGLRAGEPTAIGFTVLQHGRSPLAGLDPAPAVEARHTANGEVVRVSAVDEGSPGHYVAVLTLPSPGEWDWSVRAFGDLAQTMPALAVGPAIAAVVSVEPSRAASVPSTTLLAAAAGLAVAGMVLSFRRRFVLAGAAIALAAILGAGGLATSTAEPVPVAEAAAGQAAGPAVGSGDPAVAVGADLFMAKGCAVCHLNRRAPESVDLTLSIGPDLSNYRNDPQFLARWLANPRRFARPKCRTSTSPPRRSKPS
jgi:hypothetical protein